MTAFPLCTPTQINLFGARVAHTESIYYRLVGYGGTSRVLQGVYPRDAAKRRRRRAGDPHRPLPDDDGALRQPGSGGSHPGVADAEVRLYGRRHPLAAPPDVAIRQDLEGATHGDPLGAATKERRFRSGRRSFISLIDPTRHGPRDSRTCRARRRPVVSRRSRDRRPAVAWHRAMRRPWGGIPSASASPPHR